MAALLLVPGFFPGPAKVLLSSVSYLLSLACTLVLWTLLLGTAAAALVAVAIVAQGVGHARRWSTQRTLLVGGSAVAALLAVGIATPTVVALGVLIVLPVIYGFASGLQRAAGVRLLWRCYGGSVRSLDSRALTGLQLAAVCWAAAILGVLASGQELGGGVNQLPVTGFLGELSTWSAAAGFSVATFASLWLQRMSRPRHRGQQLAPAREMEMRYELRRGFDALFGRIGHRRFEKGNGYWVGLQHWCIQGLTRDEDEDEQHPEDSWLHGTVGPLFDSVFLPEVRAYYQHVTLALEVDLVFLEDGVGVGGLQRVIETMFEVYDNHGGARRLEELHVSGIPHIRALLHDYDLSEPLVDSGFAEPNYDQIGRARILHIFRDREEESEEDALPVETDSLPVAPAAV